MVRRMPKELRRDEYQALSVQQRRDLWIKLVSERLGVSLERARSIIEKNNMQSEWEIMESGEPRNYLRQGEYHISPDVQRRKIYPRFNANAVLLASMSSDYAGPRGPRPILASLENIAKISFDAPRGVSYWRESLGRNWEPFGEQLVNLKLTASNPNNAPKGVEFTYSDTRRGVYIPSRIDQQTARALGIIYSDGHVARNSLKLTSSAKDTRFYGEVVIPTIEEAFNVLEDSVHEFNDKSTFSGRDYKFLRLVYTSTALVTYLVNHLGFRRSEEERRERGLSAKIKDDEFKKYSKEFLSFYLASASNLSLARSTMSVGISIPDVSKPLLEDVHGMLEKVVERRSMEVRKHDTADSYMLRISTVPTLELYFGGYLGKNRRVSQTIQDYLEEFGIGRKAFKHLHELYGDGIAKYRRQKPLKKYKCASPNQDYV